MLMLLLVLLTLAKFKRREILYREEKILADGLPQTLAHIVWEPRKLMDGMRLVQPDGAR